MRKIACCLFTLIMLLSISSPAYSLTYYEPKTGASFTLPDGWTQSPLYEEREFIDVKYLSPSGESYLMYGCIDLWDYMSAEVKASYVRGEINSDFFSEEEVADFFAGTFYDKVRKENIASNDYIVLESKLDYSIYGVTDDYYVYYAIFVQNGYAYSYQLYTIIDDVSWNDFKSFLSNVNYPEEPSYIDVQSSRLSKRIVAAAVFAAFSIGIVFFIKRIKRKKAIKKPGNIVKTEELSIKTTKTTADKTRENADTINCPVCGRVLPSDSKFCSFCGETLSNNQ